MKSNASIALVMATAMFSGMAAAQDEANAAAPAEQPKAEALARTPEQVKKDVSLFLGYQNGMQMSQIPTLEAEDIETDAFMAGLKMGLNGKEPTYNQEEIQQSIQQFQQMLDERIKELSRKNLEASKQFMEQNATKEGIIKTESGLQYKIDKAGDGKKYDENDYKNPVFSIKYKGTKLDGTVFDETKGDAIDMPLEVIPGFAEALKLMPIGSKWTVYIPANLGYQENAPGPVIGPNEALIFEIELEGIKERPERASTGNSPITAEQLQELLQQQQNSGQSR